MTRTRVDSAAKHIMAAKVDTNLMKVMCGVENADLQIMHHKRMELLTEKDDLVLNVSRKLACLDTRTFHAYPAVISTLGKCTAAYKMIVAAMFAQRSAQDFHGLVNAIGQTDKVHDVHDFLLGQGGQRNRAVDAFITAYPTEGELRQTNTPEGRALVQELRTMPFYQLQGYSLGRAWASPISGDTVFSVLIGGCVTAVNGHFAMHAGQLVQWYFEFEEGYFAHTHGENGAVGQRVPARANMPQVIGKKRRKLEEPLRTNFVYPKPYVPHMGGDVYGDKVRIFGKCLNGAGPFEPVDIMIMTQSL